MEPRSTNFHRFKNKGRKNYRTDYKPQGEVQKYKFMGKGHKCRWRCHKAVYCKFKKRGNSNLVESDTVITVVSEINLIGGTVKWIVDTGATRHICADHKLFQSYENIDKAENIFIG